jgi:hypothetical protein
MRGVIVENDLDRGCRGVRWKQLTSSGLNDTEDSQGLWLVGLASPNPACGAGSAALWRRGSTRCCTTRRASPARRRCLSRSSSNWSSARLVRCRVKPRTGPARRWPISWVWRSARCKRSGAPMVPPRIGCGSFARRPAGGDQPISGRTQPQPKALHLDRRPRSHHRRRPAAGTKC